MPYKGENKELTTKQKARARARIWATANPERARSNARAYYQKHKDAIKQRVRAWKSANPDKKPSRAVKKAYWAKWYAKNRLKQRERTKRWRENHRQETRVAKQAWRKKNRDKVNAQKMAAYWRKKGVAPRPKRVRRSHEEIIEWRRQQRLKKGIKPRKKKTVEELREYKRAHARHVRHERRAECRQKQRAWAAKNPAKVRLKNARRYYKNVERSRERMTARVFLRKYRARFPKTAFKTLEQLVQLRLVIRKLKKLKGPQ